MSILTDLYQQLFGKNHIQDGNVIDMAEHGRVGGVSTGQAFKHTAIIDTTSGDAVTVTNNKLDVNATVSIPDIATETTLDAINTKLGGLSSFTPAVYDYISLSYTGDDLTGVVFKIGGSGGTTVSTLTLAYAGGVLTSVTKT